MYKGHQEKRQKEREWETIIKYLYRMILQTCEHNIRKAKVQNKKYPWKILRANALSFKSVFRARGTKNLGLTKKIEKDSGD